MGSNDPTPPAQGSFPQQLQNAQPIQSNQRILVNQRKRICHGGEPNPIFPQSKTVVFVLQFIVQEIFLSALQWLYRIVS